MGAGQDNPNEPSQVAQANCQEEKRQTEPQTAAFPGWSGAAELGG
jgi:hypothetical protein